MQVKKHGCPIGYERAGMCRECLYWNTAIKQCDYGKMKEAEIAKLRDKEAVQERTPEKPVVEVPAADKETLSIPELRKKYGMGRR
jgi:hypothetical protein